MSEQQKSKLEFRVKSNISNKLKGGNISAYGAKVNELKVEAEKISPEGSLIVYFVDRSDKFSPAVKLIQGVMDIDAIYSLRHIQSNPSLATEFAEIANHMKEIDRLIAKRKKTLNSSYIKKEVKQND
jgi:hypothetical protein